MSPRIIFVDKETPMFEPLRVLFKQKHQDWEVSFATGGEEALAMMRDKTIDVLIADIELRDMAGAELLNQVCKRYPDTARIVLSGETRQSRLLPTLPGTHRYITKPCSSTVLMNAVEGVVEKRSAMDNPSLRELVGRVRKLPSVPQCYMQLSEMAADPTKDISDAVAIVQADAAMSVRVLHVVNSGCFGHLGEVSSIPDAVMYLGLGLIKGLALIAEIFTEMDDRTRRRFGLDHLHSKWLAEARQARRFLGGAAKGEEAFTATLIRDVGKLILATEFPDELAVIMEDAKALNQPEQVIEAQRWGTTHAELGAFLLGLWGLPSTLTDVIADHHQPSRSQTSAKDILGIVHLLDTASQHAAAKDPASLESRLDMRFFVQTGQTERLATWVHRLA